MNSKILAAGAAVAVLAASAPAFAQNTSDPSVTTTTAPVEENDSGFDMGWLGLLGLAGLLGMRRKADTRVHTDATARRA